MSHWPWIQEDVLILIVGKSGSGKNWLCEKKGLISIPSYTTRPMRQGELEGKEHIFVSCYDFDLDADPAAYTEFNGYKYWVTFDQINDPEYDAYIVDTVGLNDVLYYGEMGRITKRLRVLFVNCPWYRRLWRMLFRGDGIRRAIGRLINDEKAFADFETIIRRYGWHYETIAN